MSRPRSNADASEYVRHISRLTERFDGIAESSATNASVFSFSDGNVLCAVGNLDATGRVALCCPAPSGVSDEMAEAEPTRFFAPPADASAIVGAPVDEWLGVWLDGTGDDIVDWDEIAAILDDAHGCAMGEIPSNATQAFERSPEGAYVFHAPLWVHEGQAAWHFITLPNDVAAAIDKETAAPRRGFGSIRVEVTVDTSTWATSIFPDSKRGSYLLPVKKAVRTKHGLSDGDLVPFALTIV